jgi:hypothetical protein
MGTEYYLLRPDNGALFELGKGLLKQAFEDFEDGPAQLPCTACLTKELLQAVRDYGLVNDNVDQKYIEFVAETLKIWADGKPVRFLSEHQLNDRWRVTGSRYKD